MPWDSNSTRNESLTAASSSMTYTIDFDKIDSLHIRGRPGEKWGHILDAAPAMLAVAVKTLRVSFCRSSLPDDVGSVASLVDIAPARENLKPAGARAQLRPSSSRIAASNSARFVI